MTQPHVLVFRGPVHHSQLLRPIEDALERRGARVTRWTTDTEGCFQIALTEEFGARGFEWLPEYWDEDEAQQLYRKHCEWLRPLLMEPNALSYLLPQVFDRIILAICREWSGLRMLFKMLHPTHCLALHEINRWGVMMGAHAKRLRLPYATLQEGLYYSDPFYYHGATRYSHAYLWGEDTRQKLLAAGCDEQRLHVVGHPDLAARWRKGQAEAVQFNGELPEHARGKRLALVFFGHAGVAQAIPPEALWRGIDQTDWFVVGRQHQLSALPDLEAVKALFGACPEHAWLSPNTLPLAHHWRLMAAAEAALLVGCSTLALEWCVSGKPMGRIPTGGMPRDFGAEGILVPCDTEPLAAALDKTVAQWQPGGFADRAADFVARELATRDDAADAIADAFLKQEA